MGTHTEQTTITRRFEFDSGHRVLGHEGKCRHLHGHRYVAEVTVTSPKLDSLGMIVDFSVLKEQVGNWINQWWDHNVILHKDDPLFKIQAMIDNSDMRDFPDVFSREPYKMAEGNPTAENMARELFNVADMLLHKHNLTVVSVRLYETPNSFADYTREEQE